MICNGPHFNTKVWPGLKFPTPSTSQVDSDFKYSFDDIAGLRQAGWSLAMYEAGAMADHRSFKEQCDEVITTLINHENSWPFRKPVDTKKIRDYLEVITTPMDLETIQKKVDATEVQEPKLASYQTMDEFKDDLRLMFDNARIYNNSDTIYYKYAH